MRAIIEKTYGNDTEYRRLHYWVERRLGKPQSCSECGTTDRKRYAWANISGEYKKDIKDWRRLCYSCHKKEERTGFCRNDHPLSGNLFIGKDGVSECAVCKRWLNRKYYLRGRTRLLAIQKNARLERKQ